MQPGGICESGSELLARLSARPSLRGLDCRLFEDGPKERETVELCGNLSCGKTLLLTQLLAKCILPSSYRGIPIQGRGVSAVLINNDLHFRVSKLIQVMLGIIENACRLVSVKYDKDTMRKLVINPALEKLMIINCYENNQFKFTIETLNYFLSPDSRIGLIAIDSISSFYWQDRANGGVWVMDQYHKNLIKSIHKHTFKYKVVTIYTRPEDFTSPGQNKSVELSEYPTSETINYRITLDSRCLIETARGKREIQFTINEKGITWITENQ